MMEVGVFSRIEDQRGQQESIHKSNKSILFI